MVLHFLLIHLFGLFDWLLLEECLARVCYSLHLCWDPDATSDLHITCVVAVSAGVLTQVVGQIGAYGASEALRTRRELTDLLVLKVPEFFEVRVLQQLRCSPPLVLVVYQHFLYYVRAFGRDVRDHFGKALPLLFWKVDFHMRGMLPEEVEDLLARGANYIVDLIDLVEFIVTGEQRTEGENLVHDAAYAPDIHFVAVVAVGQKALRSSVPTRGDVLGERLVLVESSTTS